LKRRKEIKSFITLTDDFQCKLKLSFPLTSASSKLFFNVKQNFDEVEYEELAQP
jgi:hypothetical protein